MQTYEKKDLFGVTHYHDVNAPPQEKLSPWEYAIGRSGIPCFCVDGVPCGRLEDGTKVIVLINRAGHTKESGPFREQLWIVGGKWDGITPFDEFLRMKARGELFGDSYDGSIDVHPAPLGNKPFATDWSQEDGPNGFGGLTIQLCYMLEFQRPFAPNSFRPDKNHGHYQVVRARETLPELHPYIRDMIALTGWLET